MNRGDIKLVIDQLDQVGGGDNDSDTIAAAINLLETMGNELARCQKDADRYRWLRKFLSSKDLPILRGRGARDEPDERDDMDAAVDANMTAAARH